MDQAQRRLSIVFMGTPAFAATILEHALTWEWAEMRAVYCQPDRPAGRGHSLKACEVKQSAQRHNLPVCQPLNFKDAADCDALAAWQPDVLLVAAYGLILPQRVLDIPQIAPINVHGSILPQYRGAAPIQRAVWDAVEQTGVAVMRMEAGLDTGPVYAVRTLPVGEHTAGSLHDALALLGAQALAETLPNIAAGQLTAVPQDNTKATHAAKLTKADGRIDFDASCTLVHAQVRAVTPWPAAQAVISLPERGFFDIQFAPGAFVPSRPISASCGALWHFGGGQWGIVTRDGVYTLHELKAAGKKMVSALSFAQGYFPKGITGVWGRVLTPAEIASRV